MRVKENIDTYKVGGFYMLSSPSTTDARFIGVYLGREFNGAGYAFWVPNATPQQLPFVTSRMLMDDMSHATPEYPLQIITAYPYAGDSVVRMGQHPVEKMETAIWILKKRKYIR